jgi:hypothetical protein
METIYGIFTKMQDSITTKSSHSEGWNSGVHLNDLVTTFKPRIFQDMPAMSKQLTLSHFQFFYTNLAPIDDDLAGTVALYTGVSLPGGEMLGHRNNIQKIVDVYKLRQMLYQVNV